MPYKARSIKALLSIVCLLIIVPAIAGGHWELSPLPKTQFENVRDWSRSLEEGLIKPDRYLKIKPAEDITFNKELVPEAEWRSVPPPVFPHKKHVARLDCNNCHPDIFNIKKKTTKHFTMKLNLENQFCGVVISGWYPPCRTANDVIQT